MNKLILIPFSVGLLIAGISMFIAWNHNPQCEIHCDGVIHWGWWFLIGGIWLFIGFIVSFVGQFIIQKISKLIGNASENT